METGSLELWAVPAALESMPAGPEISLKLPQLIRNGKYHSVKVEYNPKGPEIQSSEQLFDSSFSDSVVMLQVMIQLDALGGDQTEFLYEHHEMFLFVPRRALLQQIPLAGQTGPRERVWADWGPPVSRWIEAGPFAGYWPTIMCGQQCVLRNMVLSDTPSSFLLLDFNPYTYRKARLQQAEEGGRSPRNPLVEAVEASTNEFAELDIFEEGVDSQLGYVVTESRQEYTYDGLMIDEEWIVGIHVRFCCAQDTLILRFSRTRLC